MEQTVGNLLKKWDIPEETIDRFESNDITLNFLRELNDDLLKELCPHIGTRLLIKKAINARIIAEAKTRSKEDVECKFYFENGFLLKVNLKGNVGRGSLYDILSDSF
ncbi:hypothetical protein EVAR_90356_1 [Eumeta japonica]|uniref:SAM domain-containing protein n=1 Tax=Eumeta variegata TaxID=151549 RepID=A0A4C1Y9X4_EUMVA|nr:hypothetical protein EVAR_90356_1 [Eumeta japonica]